MLAVKPLCDGHSQSQRMKSKLQTPEQEAGEGRRGGKLEFSPVRTSSHGRSSSSRINNRTSSTGKRTSGSGASPSPGPGRTSVGSSVSPSPGPGRTPQTKRRELSLTAVEKNSPTGSPRNVNKTQASGNIRKTGTIKSKSEREVNQNSNSEESSTQNSPASEATFTTEDMEAFKNFMKHLYEKTKF